MTVTDEPIAPTLEPPQSAPAEPAGGRRRRRAAAATNGDTKPKREPKGAGRPSNLEKLTRQLEDQFAALGMATMAFHQADGLAIIGRAPALADALARLADQNPRVRRLLEGGMTSSAWLGVALAFGGLGFELAKNHGLLAPPALPDAGEVPSPFAGLADFAARAQQQAAVS